MIGAQLFGIRKEYANDPVGILHALKEMGYDAVEPMVTTARKRSLINPGAWTTSSLRERFAEVQACSLEVPSVHVDLGLFAKPAERIISLIRQVKLETGISVFVFSGMFTTEEKAIKWGTLLRRISDSVKADGCTVLYHNHDMELQTVSGKLLLDLFFEHAGPDVGLQLDIGWAGIAWDELKAAEKYADRITEIHCKDFYGEKSPYSDSKKPREKFAPIGAGIIKTEQLLAMTDAFPRFNGAVIVDQDNSAVDMMEDMRIGLNNLRRMGL